MRVSHVTSSPNFNFQRFISSLYVMFIWFIFFVHIFSILLTIYMQISSIFVVFEIYSHSVTNPLFHWSPGVAFWSLFGCFVVTF